MKRNRPYDGQIHTVYGKRGNTYAQGLTMRDIVDCFVLGILDCLALDDPDLYDKAQKGNWEYEDLYKIKDMNKIDPIAAAQNMCCHMEKMMGIYPNVPALKQND